MEISQKREYMLHFEIIIPNLQLGWKREQSGARSTWEPTGAHSGVVDCIVTSYRLALLLTAVIDHWHFLTSVCWFHALDLSLVRPMPPTGETTERVCQSVYIIPKLQWFNLANLFISFSNWLFETGLKRCYGSVIIIIIIVYNSWNGKIRPPLQTLWWHEAIRHISEAGLFKVCQ